MKHIVYSTPKTQVLTLETPAVCATKVVSGPVGDGDAVLHGATKAGKAIYAF